MLICPLLAVIQSLYPCRLPPVPGSHSRLCDERPRYSLRYVNNLTHDPPPPQVVTDTARGDGGPSLGPEDESTPLWADHNLSGFVSITSVKLWWIDVTQDKHALTMRVGGGISLHNAFVTNCWTFVGLFVTIKVSLKVTLCDNDQVCPRHRIQQLSAIPPTELILSAIIRMQIIPAGIQKKCKLSVKSAPPLSAGYRWSVPGGKLSQPQGKLENHSITIAVNVFERHK